MFGTRLHWIVAALYVAGLVALGIRASRRNGDSNQFLNATGSLPTWLCIVSYIAANCGSLDVTAMVALGAQYGLLACHFHWIGATPALVAVALWVLPAYARGRFPTVLDFIGHYYGERTRSLAALCMAAMMLLLAGVCLCAVAQMMAVFLGWSFGLCVLATSVVVLFYTWIGGLRATIYTELLHFVVVLLAIVPIFFLVLRDFGGIGPLLSRLPETNRHVWQGMPLFAPGAVMDQVGVIFGLGLILSCGYWSTDFVLMQRALAVRRQADAPFVPLSMAVAKIAFAFLLVLPGAAAPLVLRGQLGHNWNATLPSLMMHYYDPAWRIVGVLGLTASLAAAFANNVAGFSAAWMQGIYRAWIRPHATESHYLLLGRMTNAGAVLLSAGVAYSALQFGSLMEYIQMIFSTFNAPLFALVLLAALAPGWARGGGVIGLLFGVGSAGLHQALLSTGMLRYGSRMSANFYAAIAAFCITAVVALASSRLRTNKPIVAGSTSRAARLPIVYSGVTAIWALAALGLCLLVNVLLR
jgi:SSS family solute:Na+ symporter